jgi:hypothetical protein
VDKIKEARKIIMGVWDAMELVVNQEDHPLLNHKDPAHQVASKVQEIMELQGVLELVVKQEQMYQILAVIINQIILETMNTSQVQQVN